ncbi:MAG: response regulator transcription factor [Bacteroidota bacterium]|jgi:two-component system phosphate regulon response regulator PhoB/two-component system alkaline phosphatase synthesis response regulator PhoP
MPLKIKSKKDLIPQFSQSSGKLIAVLDDEPDILELVSLHLRKAGFKVKEFETSKSFLKFIEEKTPHLIILDLMLPDADGLEICKSLKKDEKFSSVPVLLLTAKSEEIDKIIGLELGADDYVTKPFSTRELVARVKALIRREQNSVKNNKVKVGGILELDLQKYETYIIGEKIELTLTEFKILKLLCERKGWVYARDQILEYLGSTDKGVMDRTIDVHIKNLREKLGPAGSFIKNIRGIGYKLEE